MNFLNSELCAYFTADSRRLRRVGSGHLAEYSQQRLGAGKADIKSLTANSRAEIDGGAGELNIDGGRLSNLNLDMGVGKLTLKSRIEGESDIDYGIGQTDLCLLGSKADYKIEAA